MIGKCSSSPESAARLTSKVQGEGEGEDHRGQDLRPEGTSHAEGLSGLGARRVLRPVTTIHSVKVQRAPELGPAWLVGPSGRKWLPHGPCLPCNCWH